MFFHFKIPYTKAAKAWRGGVSGWFDNIMSDITETKLNVTRNRWSKYIAKYIKSVTEDFKEVAKNQNKIKNPLDFYIFFCYNIEVAWRDGRVGLRRTTGNRV